MVFISEVKMEKGTELFKLLDAPHNGSSGYITHQILWELFPNDGDKKRDFIFCRVEREGLPRFILVSKSKPVENSALSVTSKIYAPVLKAGQNLAFTLLANPVVSRIVEGKKNSVKHDVWMDAKRSAKESGADSETIVRLCEGVSKTWLIRQGKRCGFTLEEKEFLIDGYTQNRFYKARREQPIRFSSIHYEGILTVTDTVAFTNMLFSGIGRSKAFGCGLMLVRRI